MSLGESGRGWPDDRADRTAPAPIAEFGRLIREGLPGITIEIDAPDNPAGEHWIDLSLSGFRTNVAWRPAHGFGVHTSETVFGEGPDEVYKRPEDAVRRVLQLEAGWRRSGGVESLWLRDLRELHGVSQTAVAKALGVTQVAVSRLEARRDVKLSSLAAYVDALGGRLELRVRFEGFDAAIVVPCDEIEK